MAIKRFFRTRRRKVLATSLAILILVTSLQLFLFLRPAKAGWSPTHGLWAKRKQLTITNNSSDSLASGTTVAITVNTKELYDANKLQPDCDDLRIIYSTSSSNHKEIDRHLEYPSGTTCSTSESTKVYLQLQASLSSSASSTDYYMYYSNLKASPTVAAFDTSSQTFTASMAKRSAPGPFTAAPIGQAEGTTSNRDVSSIPEGSQINGNFSSNFDGDQGSIVLWITPEWDGNVVATRWAVDWAGPNGRLLIGGGSTNVSLLLGGTYYTGPSISSWTAGTTYNVVARWDSRNTLDGTNHVSISVDDSHTNSGTSAPTIASPNSNIDIGGSDLSGQSINAIIEGLTIYRRPLYDGANGIDVGNGDEIDLIEASGGQDPTLVTGSWDVVFALPTNSTVGSLSTGTGEAWSHPHSSNLMYTSTTNTGGFMLNGTYTTDGWSDEGTPSSVTALSAGEKIFAGGYKTTSDAVNEGIYYETTGVSSGDDFVIRAIGNSDTTCDPQVLITEDDGTTAITSLDGTTTSDRDTPDVYLFTFEANNSDASGDADVRVKLINTAASGTCYWHQVELLSTLNSNPSMEGTYDDESGGGGGTVNIAPAHGEYSLETDGTDTADKETTTVHSGSASQKLQDVEDNEGVTADAAISSGNFYARGGFLYVTSASARFHSNTNRITPQDGVTLFSNSTSAAQWTHIAYVLRYVSSSGNPRTISTGGTFFYDDEYYYALDDVSLTVTPATITNSNESSGVRVDGRDTLTQTLSGLTVPKGTVKFKYTPRHDAADALKFLESTDVYIAEFYGDADDYIRVYWNAANTVTLAYSMAGTSASTTWDATSAIVADTTYSLRIQYTGGSNMEFFVDSAKRITLTSIPSEFGVIPVTAYWGSRQAGDRQADATYAAPTTTSEVTDDVFDIGSKDALLVCPFDGTTTCVAGETPSTESGAIRYSGSKSALKFDGESDGVTAANDTTIQDLHSGDFTAEGWFNINTAGDSSFGGLFGKTDWGTDGWGLMSNLGGRRLVFKAWFSGTDIDYNTAAGVYSYDTWTHIAIVYDSSSQTAEFFVNGSSVDTTGAATGTASSDSARSLEVGKLAGSELPGVIDEVRISNIKRYTANFTPQTAPFVRDEHTKLLYHFDENGDDPRNTGKVIDDSGNGNHGTITGAKYVGGLIGIDGPQTLSGAEGLLEGNVPRQSYAGHEGIFIEESTTNKVTNPSFDHATYNTNWTDGANITATEETTAPFYKFGSKSAKLVDVTAADTFIISINVGNTNTHMLSAYVYDGTSGNIGGTVDNTIARLVFNGTSQATTTYTDAGGGWWRLTYSAAGIASAQNFGVEVQLNKTIYLDGVQLEEKSIKTSYADGTLGSGYSWSGTAHDSTSSRTTADLRFSTTGNVNSDNGSLSLWVKPNLDNTEYPNADDGFFWRWADGSSDYQLRYAPTSDLFEFRKRVSAVEHDVDVPKTFSRNDWIHLVATWSTTTGVALYVDNGTPVTDSNTDAITLTTTTFGLGNAETGGSQVNSVMSDVRFFDDALTAAEVADLYYAGLVSRQEGIEVDRFSEEKGQNPVGVWHFDEGYGSTANDSSTYGNHLTISGATYEVGPLGGPTSSTRQVRNLKFDGTDDYASRAWDRDFNFGTGSFSISGWFRHPSTISGTDTILARYGDAGYKVYMDSSGYICFGIDADSTWTPADSACTTTSYADSKWYHFEAVKDSTSSITLYINGNEVASDNSLIATSSLNSSAPLYVGIDSDGSSNPWDGFLDEIVVYPYARDASQVKEDFLGSQTAQVYGAATDDFLTEGLVGYWPMDESSWTNDCATNTVLDSSGNNIDLDACPNTTGPTGGAAGKFGNGGDFDGSQYLTSQSDVTTLDITNEITIAFWVNIDSLVHGDHFIGKWDAGSTFQESYHVRMWGSGPDMFFRFQIAQNSSTSDSIASTTALSTGQWYHMTGVYDGSNLSVYLNGALENSSATSITSMQNSNSPLAIAAQYNSGSYQDISDGQMDEVRIYNRAFSPFDVRQLYQYGPGPVGYWQLDEGTGQNVYDRSGNASTGTLGFDSSSSTDDPVWTNGNYGNALTFDGDGAGNDFVNIGDYPEAALTDQLTLSAWIYPTAVASSSERRIVHRRKSSTRSHYFLARNQDGIVFRAEDCATLSTQFGNTSVALNTWSHVAATYDDALDTVKIYVNGVNTDTSTSFTRTICNTAGDIQIGGHYQHTRTFPGSVDDVRIYNYTRTTSQIIEDMNAGHPVGGSPLPSQVGYWTFDEGYGDTAYDAASGSNNGDLASGTTCPQTADSACPTWTNDGKFGKALDFDTAAATDDYVDLGQPSELDVSAITLSAWIKTTDTGSGTIVGKFDSLNSERSYYISINRSGFTNKANFGVSTNGTSSNLLDSTSNVNDGNWHYIAGTFDNTTRKLYIDGIEEASGSLSGNLFSAPNENVYIGAVREGSLTNYFDGIIDEVKIYNVALTADQIKLDMNQGKAAVWGATSTDSSGVGTWDAANEYCPPRSSGTCTAPLIHWSLDEGTGTSTVNDLSGNENSLTMNNFSETYWQQGKHGKALDFGTSNIRYLNRTWDDGTLSNGTLEFFALLDDDFADGSPTDQRILGNPKSGGEFVGEIQTLKWDNTGGVLRMNLNDGVGNQMRQTNKNSWNGNQWYHIAYTWDGTNLNIYVDGVLDNQHSVSHGVFVDDAFFLGAQNAATSFDGKLDEVMIYNYARSQAQIAWSYNRGEAIGYWALDECSGTTANDASGNGNNGTITIGSTGSNTSAGSCSSGDSTEAWNNGTTGKRNASLDFDGTDDEITVAQSSSINDLEELTVSAWIYLDTFGQNTFGRIVDKVSAAVDGGFMFFVDGASGNRLAFEAFRWQTTDGKWKSPISSITTGQWYHVAATYDYSSTSNNPSIYINGVSQTVTVSSTPAGTKASETQQLNIGNNDTETRSFDGRIDEVKIYNYALTQQQIRSEYNQGAIRYGPATGSP